MSDTSFRIEEGTFPPPFFLSDTPHYENVPFEVPSSWVWTTLGEISNYGECNNVSVDSITDNDWVLELEDLHIV